jgi:hypothetical protein
MKSKLWSLIGLLIIASSNSQRFATANDENPKSVASNENMEQVMMETEKAQAEVRRKLSTVLGKQPPSGIEAVKSVLADLPKTSYVKSRIQSGTLSDKEILQTAREFVFEMRDEAKMPPGFPTTTPVGEIELKRYPQYRLVKTEMDGDPTNGKGSTAFFRLFGHIQRKGIAMTTPVEMEYGESESDLTEQSMAFLYGDQSIGETGREGDVDVQDIEAKTVASMGMRGELAKPEIAQAAEKIRTWVSKNFPDQKLAGDVRVLGYNGPGVPVTKRFSEIQIEVLD